jgi:hypothetical protein
MDYQYEIIGMQEATDRRSRLLRPRARHSRSETALPWNGRSQGDHRSGSPGARDAAQCRSRPLAPGAGLRSPGSRRRRRTAPMNVSLLLAVARCMTSSPRPPISTSSPALPMTDVVAFAAVEHEADRSGGHCRGFDHVTPAPPLTWSLSSVPSAPVTSMRAERPSTERTGSVAGQHHHVVAVSVALTVTLSPTRRRRRRFRQIQVDFSYVGAGKGRAPRRCRRRRGR